MSCAIVAACSCASSGDVHTAYVLVIAVGFWAALIGSMNWELKAHPALLALENHLNCFCLASFASSIGLANVTK